jgi:hypothetical protein
LVLIKNYTIISGNLKTNLLDETDPNHIVPATAIYTSDGVCDYFCYINNGIIHHEKKPAEMIRHNKYIVYKYYVNGKYKKSFKKNIII